MLSPKDYSKFEYDGSAMEGRYLHLQLTPEEWRTLEQSGDIPPERHWRLKGDEWMAECMPQPELQSEYHLKTHWQIILSGSRGGPPTPPPFPLRSAFAQNCFVFSPFAAFAHV